MSARKVVHGVFRASELEGLPELRDAVLNREACHPPLSALPVAYGDVSALREVAREVGIGFAMGESAMDAPTFLKLAAQLGVPMLETDAETSQYVRNGAVMILDTALQSAVDASLQPFSIDPIALHTEGSRAAAAFRPDALLFHVGSPAKAGMGGQTLVVSVDSIVERLDKRTRGVLAATRFENHPEGDSVLTCLDGQWALSARDFRDAPWRWANDAGHTARCVASALAELMYAMYLAPINSLPLQEGLIVYIRNARMVHGRTAFRQVENGRLFKRICLRG